MRLAVIGACNSTLDFAGNNRNIFKYTNLSSYITVTLQKRGVFFMLVSSLFRAITTYFSLFNEVEDIGI